MYETSALHLDCKCAFKTPGSNWAGAKWNFRVKNIDQHHIGQSKGVYITYTNV